MITLADKQTFVRMRDRLVDVPAIYYQEYDLRKHRYGAQLELNNIHKSIAQLRAKPDRKSRDSIEHLEAQIPAAVMMRDLTQDNMNEFVSANKANLVAVDDDHVTVIVGMGSDNQLLPLTDHQTLTCRKWYRLITFLDPEDFIYKFRVRDWEVNGFPPETDPEEKLKEYRDLDESLKSTVVLSPNIVREKPAFRKAVYDLVLHRKRSGILWCLARSVLRDILDYDKASVLACYGLHIKPYQQSATCVRDQQMLQAVDQLGVATAFKQFEGKKIVLRFDTIQLILFKLMGVACRAVASGATYKVDYKPYDTELKIKGKRI